MDWETHVTNIKIVFTWFWWGFENKNRNWHDSSCQLCIMLVPCFCFICWIYTLFEPFLKFSCDTWKAKAIVDIVLHMHILLPFYYMLEPNLMNYTLLMNFETIIFIWNESSHKNDKSESTYKSIGPKALLLKKERLVNSL